MTAAVAGSRPTHAVSAIDVSKFYGEVAALDRVSLEIGAGRFMTLLGPSGSGKTTLLMAIAGFVALDRGEIRVDGRGVTHLPPEKRNFGMVFQGYALFPHLSVADNVAFPLRLRRMGRVERDEKVRRVLDMVQLGALGQRLPRQLSGGQQQRVALARALVFDPDVLLLDEPLSALDKKLRADLQWELKEIHRRLGMTFVCVTHDQDEALSMSDRVAILHQGRIIQEGEPAELYEKPRTRFAAEFLGQSNFVAGRVGRCADGEALIETAAGMVRQAVDAAVAPGSAALLALRPEKITLAPTGAGRQDNVVAGTLVAWTYHGPTMTCRVESALGALLVVVPTWNGSVAPCEGLPVDLGWSAAAGRLVLES